MTTKLPQTPSHRLLLPLTAFLAVLPLLLKGPTCGHDFDFHLLSWLEAATQYRHGGYPHWAFTPAWNAGEPRFLFYPPISWTLGALLTLILPVQYAASAFTFLALTVSGFTAHRLASRYASPQAALLAAILYQLNPYMLFTAYERSAFAELLAAAWLPLLFLAALAPPGVPHDHRSRRRRLSWAQSLPHKILRVALPIALLWLTNAPAAVMGCYALAILTATRLLLPTNPGAPPLASERWEEVPSRLHGPAATPGAPSFRSFIPKGWGFVRGSERPSSSPNPTLRAPFIGMSGSTPRLHLTLTSLAGTALGLLLPAFYLLPAAYERRYVQITLATIAGMRPQDHFLFHRMPTLTPDDLFHNDVVRTASIVSLLLLAAIALALALAWLSGLKARPIPAWGEAPGTRPNTNPRAEGPPHASLKARLGVSSSSSTNSTLSILLPLTLLLAFLLTPPSLFLWNHTPQLLFLQFPWRLNALLAVILLISVATLCPIHRGASSGDGLVRQLAVPPALALLLILPAYSLFHQPCDSTDTPTARAALFHSYLGTEPTDEYTPTNADNDALHPGTIPWWFRCLSTHPDPNDQSSRMPLPGQAPIHIEHDMPCDALVILNRRAWPDWLVTVNGQPYTAAQPLRDDGLIAFIAPRGHLSLHIRYLRTPDQKLGLLLSALALLIAIALFLTKSRLPKPRPDPDPLVSI